MAGKPKETMKEGQENNKADYHSWHPEVLAMQKSQARMSQAEFELREMVGELGKDSEIFIA